MAELGPGSAELHHHTGVALFACGLDVLISVGEGAEGFSEGFREAGGEAQHCVTREEAAAWLAAHVVPGDRVLLKGSRVARMEDVVTRLRELVAGRTD
jgi:UDP-N-acetylmuramoyl-tripeptide--D-alanyl-D-alanine ligase